MSLFTEDAYKEADQFAFFKHEKPGDSLEGEVVSVRQGVPGDFGPQIVVSFLTEKGLKLALGATETTVLGQKLVEARFEPGDLGGVRYQGTYTTRNGKEAKKWVVLRRAASAETPAVTTTKAPF